MSISKSYINNFEGITGMISLVSTPFFIVVPICLVSPTTLNYIPTVPSRGTIKSSLDFLYCSFDTPIDLTFHVENVARTQNSYEPYKCLNTTKTTPISSYSVRLLTILYSSLFISPHFSKFWKSFIIRRI